MQDHRQAGEQDPRDDVVSDHSRPVDLAVAGSRRSPAWRLLAAAGLVVALALAAVAVVATRGQQRPVLAVVSGDDGAAGIVARGPGGRYVLAGRLPTDGPTTGRVHPLRGDVPRERAQALATALHLGPVRADRSDWLAGDEHVGFRLSGADGRWSTSACAIPPPAPSAGTGGVAVACAVTASTRRLPAASPPACAPDRAASCPAMPRTSTETRAPIPTPAASLRSVADAVLAVEGIAPTQARVDGDSLSAEPTVAGLPTVGLGTSISLAPDGTIAAASGWLGSAGDGDSYPLIGADAAFRLLQRRPMPLHAMPCRAEQPGGCGGAPQRIIGARPGLVLGDGAADGAHDKELLVPAWLFDVAGGGIASQVAIEQGQLAPPTGSTSNPGSTAPTPSALPPVAISASPVGPPAEAGGLPFQVTGSGGTGVTVSWSQGACTARSDRAVLVSQDDRQVVLRVPVRIGPAPALRACPDYLQLLSKRVELGRPLGGEVIDATTGQPAPNAPDTTAAVPPGIGVTAAGGYGCLFRAQLSSG